MNAEAQMHSFEKGLGWFYWTWVTEDAVQWSWKGGMKAGILPKKSWIRDFECDSPVEGFRDLSESN
jgi:glucan 1,3-beta-glucosidase